MMVTAPDEDVELFRQLVRQRVEKLRDDVHTAAEGKELYVDNNHTVDTTKVLDLFRLRKAKVFREVFKIVDGNKIFEIYTGNYFKQIYDLSQLGYIEENRALIVINPSSHDALRKAAQLISFYRATSKYEARTITKVDFDSVHRDCGLEKFEDFGIYGNALLFRTLEYDPINRGKYSYDSLKIKKHIEFFDACWNLHSSIGLPDSMIEPSLDELLKL